LEQIGAIFGDEMADTAGVATQMSHKDEEASDLDFNGSKKQDIVELDEV
jgi:hypothetical protein